MITSSTGMSSFCPPVKLTNNSTSGPPSRDGITQRVMGTVPPVKLTNNSTSDPPSRDGQTQRVMGTDLTRNFWVLSNISWVKKMGQVWVKNKSNYFGFGSSCWVVTGGLVAVFDLLVGWISLIFFFLCLLAKSYPSSFSCPFHPHLSWEGIWYQMLPY